MAAPMEIQPTRTPYTAGLVESDPKVLFRVSSGMVEKYTREDPK